MRIAFAHYCHDVFSAFLAPLLPILIAKLGISYTLAGSLPLLQRLPSLANPLIGWFADRSSLRGWLIAAPLVTALTMAALGLAGSFEVLALLIFVQGMSSAVWHVPAPVMIRYSSGNRLGKGMSYYMLGGELARSTGPLVVLAAISLGGLRGPLYLVPLGLIASLLLAYRPLPRGRSRASESSVELEPAGIRRELTPLFAAVTGYLVFRSMPIMALSLFLPTLLTHSGKSLWFAGSALSLFQLSGALGTFSAGALSDRLGRRAVLFTVSCAAPIFVWFFLHTSGILAMAMLVSAGIVLFASGPVLLALIQDHAKRGPALVNGVYMTINFLTSSLIALGVGALSDRFGLLPTFRLCALGSFLAAPFALLLPGKK
ncbi:MFS transporter [candidate division KSB1 bacterium]|nr:MFS transporter [candidate division KSB1 bacterium]